MAKIRALRRCELLKSLDYKDLGVLAVHVKEEVAEPTSWLAEEGKPSDGLIVISKGSVKVILPSVPDAEITLGPGDFFGEFSLASAGDGKRRTTAMATERCEYLRLDAAAYRELQKKAPEIASKIALGIVEVTARHLSLSRDALKADAAR